MKYFKQFGWIMIVTCIGEIMKYYIPLPIPASIYGLVLMMAVLMTGVVKIEKVYQAGTFLIEIMSLMFIPAAVGIIESWDQLRRIIVPVSIITIITTFAVMIVSGNDSAVALAETVAESESNFVTMMNEKAKELGLENSTFTNASGLTKNGQDNKMSTRDIFTLSKAIIEKYPEVLEYAKTTVLEQPARNFKKESTIPLVGQVEGVDGLKTGHTDEAGYCLVSTMKIKKGDSEFRVISVLMGAKTKADRAQYMKDMLNYVKQNIETRKLVDVEKFTKRVEVKSANQGYIELVPKEDLERVSMKGINYDTEVTVDDVKLPLKKGDKVGEIKVKNSKEVIATVDLVAKEDYSKAGIVKRIGRFFKTVFEVVETILP